MAISQNVKVAAVSLHPTGTMIIQTITIFEDPPGTEIGRSAYNRYVKNPHDDLTGEPDEVVALAATWWTPSRVAKYDAVVDSYLTGETPPEF